MKTLRTRRATVALATIGLVFGAAACGEEDEGVDVDTEVDEGAEMDEGAEELEEGVDEMEEGVDEMTDTQDDAGEDMAEDEG